jgi:hypothetical protein
MAHDNSKDKKSDKETDVQKTPPSHGAKAEQPTDKPEESKAPEGKRKGKEEEADVNEATQRKEWMDDQARNTPGPGGSVLRR